MHSRYMSNLVSASGCTGFRLHQDTDHYPDSCHIDEFLKLAAFNVDCLRQFP